ncbi:hypothetical protein PAPYR_12262 [Paratrimastix pyriformis]|uniref:Uncharacterized protein n=1 Tax=Paratrimastix pyriformis TaxID=342808 RepID=A0ABQ8U5T9_9EUKA|nr:hypothetical protein PAPYR_12262 [Paratrimastix pyriformis]
MEAAGTPVLVSVDGNDAKLLCLDLGQDFAVIKQTIASHFNVAQISKISFLVTSYGVGPVSTELGADTLPLARLEPHLVFRATSGIEKLERAPATSAAFEAAFLAAEIYARRAFGQLPLGPTSAKKTPRHPGTARRCYRPQEAVLSSSCHSESSDSGRVSPHPVGSREVTHLYVLLGPLDEAVWRAKKPQIYEGLSEIGFRRIFLQSHQSPAGIMFYLPEEDWVGAQCVTRFLGDCSLGVFRVGDPDKFRLCLVDHGSRPRRMIDFDRHPDSDSNSAKEMDFGVAPSSACRSQGLLSPLATPTATATAPPPAPLETPAASLETPAARLDAASSCSSRPSRDRVGRRTMTFNLNYDVLAVTRTRSGQS